jgi:hypothetical protein
MGSRLALGYGCFGYILDSAYIASEGLIRSHG